MTPAPPACPFRFPLLPALVGALLLAAAAPALAQEGVLTLPDALAAAAARSGVVNARLAADDAREGVRRSDADPLALRFDRLQARQQAELAERQLEIARFDAYAEIAAAYTGVRSASAQTELARFGRDLAAQALAIAEIRFERGSATDLDVRSAETDLADADKNLAAAEQGLELARSSLASLTGLEADALAPIAPARLEQALASVPGDDALGEALAANPALLQAAQGLELARVGRELLDPSFAARVQIDQAELQVQQAETGVREARRGLELQGRALRNAVVTADENLRVAADAAANAREREALERQRLDAGLIAEIAFRQSALQRMQADLAVMQARHDLLAALLDLQAGTGIALEGLHGF